MACEDLGSGLFFEQFLSCCFAFPMLSSEMTPNSFLCFCSCCLLVASLSFRSLLITWTKSTDSRAKWPGFKSHPWYRVAESSQAVS